MSHHRQDDSGSHGSRQPLKKRSRRADSITDNNNPNALVSSFASPPPSRQQPETPIQTPSSYSAYKTTTPTSAMSQASKAANQKWDEMFECLMEFIDFRRETDTEGRPDTEKLVWKWDGNVPTTYKTKDGRALGRWINNQRSARNKGNLRAEREMKLVGTGLKWSVLASNPWQDMLQELRLYVQEKTKDGKAWDGNVPTNYRINRADCHEDKNLGRWINRQRTLYQTGKLRKDRELELEKIGLKWSVLSTNSWDEMYNSLLLYVKERKASDPHNSWDGNVPANHKTNDNPPRALGRWINRQRSNYMKGKLKKEFVDKLNMVGLRWCVHDRKPPPPASASPPALVASSDAAAAARRAGTPTTTSSATNAAKPK